MSITRTLKKVSKIPKAKFKSVTIDLETGKGFITGNYFYEVEDGDEVKEFFLAPITDKFDVNPLTKDKISTLIDNAIANNPIP